MLRTEADPGGELQGLAPPPQWKLALLRGVNFHLYSPISSAPFAQNASYGRSPAIKGALLTRKDAYFARDGALPSR